jgi:hypothetical protein
MYIDPAYVRGAEFSELSAVYEDHPLTLSAVGGSVYKFRKFGDKLPVHAHVPGKSHLVIVLEGAVIYREIHEGMEVDTPYDAPAVLLVPDNVSHTVISTVDNTTTLHILLSKLAD